MVKVEISQFFSQTDLDVLDAVLLVELCEVRLAPEFEVSHERLVELSDAVFSLVLAVDFSDDHYR